MLPSLSGLNLHSLSTSVKEGKRELEEEEEEEDEKRQRVSDFDPSVFNPGKEEGPLQFAALLSNEEWQNSKKMNNYEGPEVAVDVDGTVIPWMVVERFWEATRRFLNADMKNSVGCTDEIMVNDYHTYGALDEMKEGGDRQEEHMIAYRVDSSLVPFPLSPSDAGWPGIRVVAICSFWDRAVASYRMNEFSKSLPPHGNLTPEAAAEEHLKHGMGLTSLSNFCSAGKSGGVPGDENAGRKTVASFELFVRNRFRSSILNAEPQIPYWAMRTAWANVMANRIRLAAKPVSIGFWTKMGYEADEYELASWKRDPGGLLFMEKRTWKDWHSHDNKGVFAAFAATALSAGGAAHACERAHGFAHGTL